METPRHPVLRSIHFLFAGLAVLTALLPASGAAQAIRIDRLDGTVVLDGLSDEPAWRSVDPLPMTMYQPEHGGEPTEKTEIRLAYDDEYLYVSARMFDTRPEGIRTNSLYRDRYSGDDLLAVILDTFNDNENALFFHINPAGVRLDVELSNDAEGAFYTIANFDWNTYWDAEAVRTERGWFAEMRIPFSSMGFQTTDDRTVMGLIVYRYIARKNEIQVFPDIPADRRNYQPSQGADVMFRDIQARNPVYVTPYVLTGASYDPLLDPGKETTLDAGLDLKYNLTNNVTVDLTVNTDFAQAEADEQRVNLTRFDLFFPEKRRFFQERASIFEFSTGFQNRLFHSRRIGLSSDGIPIPILGGARTVGRVNGWDFGLLNMQTTEQGDLPTENHGVLRLRRRVVNPFSYAGGMLTSRLGPDGAYNAALGLDGVIRVSDADYLTVQAAQTLDSGVEASGLDSALGRIRFERRRQTGLRFFGDVAWIGPSFMPGLGFVTRRDVTKLVGNTTYRRLAGGDTAVLARSTNLRGLLVARNEDGSIESGFLAAGWMSEWNQGTMLQAEFHLTLEDLEHRLALSGDAVVPVGQYTFYQALLSMATPTGRPFRFRSTLQAGSFYDGRRVNASLEPTWNASRHLELGLSWALDIVRFPQRNQSLDAHIARLRVRAALDRRVSLNTFVQLNSVIRQISVNSRFRYNIGEGHDLWIVYNDTPNYDRGRTTPSLPWTNGRSLQLKYTHTFIR